MRPLIDRPESLQLLLSGAAASVAVDFGPLLRARAKKRPFDVCNDLQTRTLDLSRWPLFVCALEAQVGTIVGRVELVAQTKRVGGQRWPLTSGQN